MLILSSNYSFDRISILISSLRVNVLFTNTINTNDKVYNHTKERYFAVQRKITNHTTSSISPVHDCFNHRTHAFRTKKKEKNHRALLPRYAWLTLIHTCTRLNQGVC